MTCIVAVREVGVVYMGADSAGVAGYQLVARKDKKVFTTGEFLIGFTSSFRMGQLLRHKLKVPEQEGGSVEDFMATVFIDAVRECFKQGGVLKNSSGVEEGGQFLVGYRGRIFNISSDFQVGENILPFDACGCGTDVALGALASTKGMNPTQRVRNALRVAEMFSAGVRAPFNIKTTQQ